jgi:ferritin
MITKKMQDALNEQVKHEVDSSYIYLSMAANFYHQGWEGMAKWMKKQSHEERTHAEKFFKHLVDRESRVELKSVTKPKTEWATPLEAFKDAYKHEQFITGKINELVKLAEEEKDYPASVMLQWFVDEQVEEEANASMIVQQLERVGDSGTGLYVIDAQLGKRE